MPNPVPLRPSGALPELESVTVWAAEDVPDGSKQEGLKLAIGAAAETVRGKFAEFELPTESLTVTVTVKFPSTVGVPERTPPGDIVNPAGCSVAVHV